MEKKILKTRNFGMVNRIGQFTGGETETERASEKGTGLELNKPKW